MPKMGISIVRLIDRRAQLRLQPKRVTLGVAARKWVSYATTAVASLGGLEAGVSGLVLYLLSSTQWINIRNISQNLPSRVRQLTTLSKCLLVQLLTRRQLVVISSGHAVLGVLGSLLSRIHKPSRMTRTLILLYLLLMLHLWVRLQLVHLLILCLLDEGLGLVHADVGLKVVVPLIIGIRHFTILRGIVLHNANL